jgi:hypothetical protein
MNKVFNLVVTETLQRNVEIEAASESEALEILERKYYDEEIVLDNQDLIDTEFTNSKYTEKEIQILNQIHCFCKLECGEGLNNCVEENCPLYRIEQIIAK